MRKGQYLAIESMLTFAMGIILAIGTITVFSSYRADAMEEIRERQIILTEAKITEAVNNLKGADRAVKTIKLPEEIGDQDYTLNFHDGLKIVTTSGEIHSLEHLSRRYNFSGSSSGGDVNIIKNGNEFRLGPA